MVYNPFFPFTSLFETKKYPNARTLRTSFTRKLLDAFFVMTGWPPVITDKPYVGIFDYLTLGIPTLMLFIPLWLLDADNKYLKLLSIPFFAANIPFLLARFIISAVAVALFSPVIAVVHAFSVLFSQQSHKEALDLKGNLQDGTSQSLGNFIKQKGWDIENIDLNFRVCEDSAKNIYYLLECDHVPGLSASLICQGCLNKTCGVDSHAPFSVKVSLESKISQAKNIHALFKLNMGGVVSSLEENGSINDKEKQEILAI